VLVTRGAPDALLGWALNPGDLWALATVPVWALFTVLLKRRPPELDALVLLAAMAVVGLTLMAPLYAWSVWVGARMVFTPATVGTLAYMAVFASLLAYVCWNSAVRRVGPNRVGPYLHLHPVFTALLAMAFLGERLHAYHAVGIPLIGLGLYLTTAGPAPAARAAVRRA
jgi:drug/metabolite transporter (DMT)-like permease